MRELRALPKPEIAARGVAGADLLPAAADLASFDERISAFVVDSGRYMAELGRSADDIVQRLPFVAKASERKGVTIALKTAGAPATTQILMQ